MARAFPDPYFPDELLEAVGISHAQYAADDSPSKEFTVFIVIHEGMPTSEESMFTIEGVFSRLDLANNKVMDLFQSHYHATYKKADFYNRNTFQGIGENSVGWYTSRNGTLALDLHAREGRTFRIYAEEHELEST